MARRYKIVNESIAESQWAWYWYCTDFSASGFARSRSEARRLARENCTGSGCVCPPSIQAEMVRGHVCKFQACDIFGKNKTYSTAEISEDIFYYIFGYEDYDANELDDVQVVVSLLKIWGIYKKGSTISSIRRNHNLTVEQYTKLYSREWLNLTIIIGDDEEISWDFGA